MQNQTDQSYQEGNLPASAPLANPFVPFQQNNPPKYEAKKGLVRGTLFPGLDLPFLGMVNHEELPDTPLAQLQTLMFAVHELALYLDTHQDDQEAFSLYRQYQEILNRYRREYSDKFGMLNHNDFSDSPKYGWLKGPWPWEFAENREE